MLHTGGAQQLEAFVVSGVAVAVECAPCAIGNVVPDGSGLGLGVCECWSQSAEAVCVCVWGRARGTSVQDTPFLLNSAPTGHKSKTIKNWKNWGRSQGEGEGLWA